MATNVAMREVMKENFKVLKRMNPDIDPKILKKILKEAIIKNLKDPRVELKNNYRDTSESMTLIDVIELMYGNSNEGTIFDKPIMTGYGVLYWNQNQGVSKLGEATQTLLDRRKVYKNKMFEYINSNPELYKYYKLIQNIYKVLANSIYGVLGQSSAIFYNMYSAPAITYTGVVAVTTAVNAFEAFLGNNFKLKRIDDVVKYIDDVLSEEYEYDFEAIFEEKDLISNERLTEYLYNKMEILDDFSEELLEIAVSPLSVEDCTKIYYKNNLREFLALESIKENFLSPILDEKFKEGKPNETAKELLDGLYDVLKEWVVFYKIPFNRYEFAMTSKRRSSIVTDTDSTFLNLNYFVHFMGSEFKEKVDIKDVDDQLEVVNVMIYILSKFIGDFMYLLSTNMNVPEEYKDRLMMKSEYLYRRLVLTQNKKSYAGKGAYSYEGYQRKKYHQKYYRRHAS